MIKITIRTDDAAFDDYGYEAARILRRLADAIERADRPTRKEVYPLRDTNGNRVGEATATK